MKRLALLVAILSSIALAEPVSKDQILSGAEARIEQIRKGDARLIVLDAEGKPLPAGVELQIEQTRHQFLFGCNLFKLFSCRTPEDNAAYEKYFAELLNYATLPFYWWTYEPTADRNLDASTDRAIAWCREHNITTKGHPLAWNYVDPKWLPDDFFVAMELQMQRIDRAVKRFDPAILYWDVVNEATHYDRAECFKQSPKLSGAIRKMGVPAYIRQAFATARKANPKANLIINDYRTDPAYEDLVLSKLVDESGKPMYDIIGIQSHMHSGYWGAEKTWKTCEYFARFKKPLHFTETTLVSGPKTDKGWESTPEGEAAQARDVVEFYTILFSHPSVEAITWWDFTDQGAWQSAPAGFLRTDMTPKPAYDELKKLIKNKWWTTVRIRSAADGRADFRGFYGQYVLKASVDGKPLSVLFELTQSATDPIRVQLE